LQEIVNPGERVAIVVNDITRLAHSDVFLPVLVDELNLAGIPDRNIVVVFALGNHRRHTAEEQRQIVGEDLARRISLIDHDAFVQNNLSFVGRTTYGNEIWVNRRVREADRVILTGEIIYHLIAGYSGGRKSLVPGVAGAATISFNHKFILDPRCRAGALDGNPAHEDMLEACGLFKPDFLLNVILNGNGKLAGVVAGHYDQAHRAGCETVNEIHQVPFERPYDVVIASAGGFPFDIDLRQAHKGMENAARALRPGGTLLYFAECREGAGVGALSEWVERFSSSGEMALALQSHFVVGGHKAYWIVRLGERMRVLLISELPETLVRNCHLVPASDSAVALRTALEEAGPKARVAYIPDASLTFPSSSKARVATVAA
jgi:nickel-dependent lactate racemase